jgi:hypothetical protein
MSVVLRGFETWVSHTKEQGLRASDNRVLRKVSGFERVGEKGVGWTELRQSRIRPIYRELVGARDTAWRP